LGAIPLPSQWSFDDSKYLESKNVVDAQSFNVQVIDIEDRIRGHMAMVVVVVIAEGVGRGEQQQQLNGGIS